ncbi:hypothetical protein [Prochlorococcus sp. MIT 1307]|uniref:hypothetical protein n=1 Tax=Prochlorococcus sp. MIT 1307 TaxID=3096219 RepID=UPI002A75709E|nr:hypothetical protein [Prochlorococcus sp. MIT 1307]
MLLKVRILTISFTSALVLLLMLCLGAQNLNSRHTVKLGKATTAPLPSGFIVGVSIIAGVISGGSAAAVLIPTRR